MYVGKLDGRIQNAFFDRKSAEWRGEQERIEFAIQQHRNADRNYIDEGVQLLELASRAADLFKNQESAEKRELLRYVEGGNKPSASQRLLGGKTKSE